MAVNIKYYYLDGRLEEFQDKSPAHFCLKFFRARKTPFTVHKGFNPSSDNDITNNFVEILSYEGDFSVIETPGISATALLIAGAVVSIVSAVVVFLSMPDTPGGIGNPNIPKPVALKNVNRQQESPNNALANRSNVARINERIPDIGGQVNSIPDIIMGNYRKFFDNVEEEISYYCVGRKELVIEEIKDGDTLVSDITDASAAVYGPFTSPNSGDSPEIQIGPVIDDLISTVRRSVEVGGLILRASNETPAGGFTSWFSFSTLKVDRFWVNAIAPRGMFKDDGIVKSAAVVDFTTQWQFLNDDRDPVGSISSISGAVSGDDTDQKGTTVEIEMGSRSYVRVRVKRDTLKDFEFEGTVVDEIQWRDLYGSQDVSLTDFGDVTTIHTRRIRNEQSASIATPVLSCLATEKVDKYIGNGAFAGTLTPNTQAMQTLIRMALDPKIGGRDISELDLDQLLQTQADIETYFGEAQAGEFNYTFDSTRITPQEIFYTITNAVFSVPYRIAKVLFVEFEQPQLGPEMVFTHRSKKPGVEIWSRRFNNSTENDGVVFKWQNRETNTQELIFFPVDRSATNPKIYEIPGIANFRQAQWRAWREFQRLRYGRIAVDFTVTAEGRFIRPSRMISVVKGTRVATFDGYIRSVDGLEIELSQAVEFTQGDDHFIILKKRDGDIQSIPVIAGVDNTHIVLLEIPEETIYTANSALKTEFSFGPEARLDGQRILPLTIDPTEKQYVRVTGVNYDERYYTFDILDPLTRAHSTGFSEGFS